jgi:hypothetical protein
MTAELHNPLPPDPRHTWHTGDACWITVEGRRVEGEICMASPNSRSLIVDFEAVLLGFVGRMALGLREGADGYTELFTDTPAKLEPRDV